MAQLPSFYIGDVKKYAFTATAPGFSMDTDDFDLELKSPKASIKASKGASTEALRIFFEEQSVETPSEEPGGQPTVTTVKQWFFIMDTTTLTKGTLQMITTVYVPDANASGGVRRETNVLNIATLNEI